MDFVKQMESTGIIPVIKLDDVSKAVSLAEALRNGGINAAEVTFRAKDADKAIAAMTKSFPDMLVGAGTVLTVEQVDAAIAAGAKFCVAPGLNPKVVEHCLSKGVPFVPGVANGSQIEQALELGLKFVKFFPAEQAGGIAYIKAVSAPYAEMRFMPTGGIGEANMAEYLSNPKVVCCGGSWIVPSALVNSGDWNGITNLCKTAVDKMLNFRLAHVGINAQNEQEALSIAKMFQTVFGWNAKEGNSSVFAGSVVEVMKNGGKGRLGHIAVATPNVDRAVARLLQKGVVFDADSFKFDENGKLKVAYLAEEIGGFAAHFVKG